MKPDFLITPYVVKVHKKLRKGDGDVYAICYWLERLKDGKCTAGNDTIADLLDIEERSVRGALERLEAVWFVQRVYDDPERRVRKEIRTLVRYGVIPENPLPQTPAVQGLFGEEPTRKETPGEIARKFFSGQTFEEVLEGIVSKHPKVDKDWLRREMRAFILHWTEPTKNGLKQLWETRDTFELGRRLSKWLNGAKIGTGRGPRPQSGAGASI